MTDSVVVDGVRCVRAPRSAGDPPTLHGPQLWWFLPTTVVPERTGGRVNALLVPSGDVGLLHLGAGLGPAPDEVDALRSALAAQLGLGLSAVALSPAPLTIEAAELRLAGRWPADAAVDGPTVLARVRPSGAYPHTALLNARLDAEQTAAASAALFGGQGLLTVHYVGIAWEPSVLATRSSTRFSSSFSSTTTTTTTTRRTTTASPSTPAGMTLPADEPAVQHTEDRLSSQDAEVSVTVPALPEPPHLLDADVGTWFDATSGPHHVMPARPI